MSLKLRNIILITIFLSVCFLCDSINFAIIKIIIFPPFTCNFEHTLSYHLYQTSEIYKVLHDNIELTTCIFGCLYFLFFRVYVFQKWVSIIENNCHGLFLYDFLKELRRNKQILLNVNILFLFISVVMLIFYCDALDTNYIFSFIFFYPFHYLILYIRWAIKDKNIKNEISITRKYHIIQYVNYIVISNFMVIMCSSCLIPLCLVSCTMGFIDRFICFILVLLAFYYAIYYSCYYITHNIKIFIISFISIVFSILLLIYDLMYESNILDRILTFIFVTIYNLILMLGIISSLFINKLTKIIACKDINN